MGDVRDPSTSSQEVRSHPSFPDQIHRIRASAPALLGEKYRLPTITTPAALYSLDARRLAIHQFPLDPEAPVRKMRINQQLEGNDPGMIDSHEGKVEVPRPDAPPRARTLSGLQSVKEEQVHGVDVGIEGISEATSHLSLPQDLRETEGNPPQIDIEGVAKDVPEGGSESWGDSFAVEWLCTDRVSFNRTRHLRNPWNHDKEVKVSRDGTELEPTIGQQLLDEWPRLAAESGISSTPSSTPGAGRGGGGGGRGAQGPRPNLGVDASGSINGMVLGKDGAGGGRGTRGREGGQSRS